MTSCSSKSSSPDFTASCFRLQNKVFVFFFLNFLFLIFASIKVMRLDLLSRKSAVWLAVALDSLVLEFNFNLFGPLESLISFFSGFSVLALVPSHYAKAYH
jgi:hypothetical protein